MIKEYLSDIKCKILVNALSEDVREEKNEEEANCGVLQASCGKFHEQPVKDLKIWKALNNINVNIKSITAINQSFLQNCKKQGYESALIINCVPKIDPKDQTPIYSAAQAYQRSLQTELQKHYKDLNEKNRLKVKYVNSYPESHPGCIDSFMK